MKTTKARNMNPESGMLVVLAGPGGIGKSTMAGKLAEYFSPDEVLVLVTLAREAKSLIYQKHNLDMILFEDSEWDPANRKYKATAFDELLATLEELATDTKYKGIIIDSGTFAAELAWNGALSDFKVETPADIAGGSRWLPYTRLETKMLRFIYCLSNLTNPSTAALPKIVAIPWHVQPQKSSVDDTETADEKGQDVEYTGKLLPRIKGGFRRRLIDLVDVFVYCDRVFSSKGLKEKLDYRVQVVSDRERHCKLPGDLSVLGGDKTIESSWTELMKLVQRAEPEAPGSAVSSK